MLTFSDEKSPIHFRPAKICSSCSLVWNVVLDLIAAMRSFSSDDGAPRIFCVASFHGIDSLQ